MKVSWCVVRLDPRCRQNSRSLKNKWFIEITKTKAAKLALFRKHDASLDNPWTGAVKSEYEDEQKHLGKNIRCQRRSWSQEGDAPRGQDRRHTRHKTHTHPLRKYSRSIWSVVWTAQITVLQTPRENSTKDCFNGFFTYFSRINSRVC